MTSQELELSEQQPKIFWLASYPKSGNTWFRIFLANLQSPSSEPVNINQIDYRQTTSTRSWLDNTLGFDTTLLSLDEINNLRPAAHAWLSKTSD